MRIVAREAGSLGFTASLFGTLTRKYSGFASDDILGETYVDFAPGEAIRKNGRVDDHESDQEAVRRWMDSEVRYERV